MDSQGSPLTSVVDTFNNDLTTPSTPLSGAPSSPIDEEMADKHPDVMPRGPRRPKSQKRPYRKRMSTEEKLAEAADLLQNRFQWTFKQFMLAWVGANGKDGEIPSRRYRTAHHRRKAAREVLDADEFHQACGTKPGIDVDVILFELKSLMAEPYFGKYDQTMQFEALDFTEGSRIIKTTAPTWYAFLTTLLQNERAHRESAYNMTSDALSRRIFMVTVIVCHSRARGRSSSFQSLLAIYLQGSGTRRRVIDKLSGLGICLGYDSRYNSITAGAENSKESAQSLEGAQSLESLV